MATTIQVRVDDEMKKSADALFSSLGLDISTAVRMFLATSIMYRGIPFESRLQYNAETIEAIEDAKAGRNLIGPFDSVDEMMASLLSEDDNAEA